MILPFLGHVGKARFGIHGLSSINGFKLDIHRTLKDEPFRFAISGFDPDADNLLPSNKRRFFLNAVILLLVSVLYFLTNDSSMPFLISLLYCCFATFVMSYLIYWFHTLAVFFKNTELREWHSCEHKSVVLLGAGLEPTVENLKKCPAVLVGCGTVTFGVRMEYFLSVFYLLSRNFLFIHPTALDLLAFCLIFSCCAYSLIGCIVFKKSNFLFASLLTPCTVLPLLAEWLCTTKEPSRYKMNKTVQELKAFIELNQLYRQQETPD